MHVVAVRELSHKGVSRVISRAESEPVLITKNNQPDVWMVSARSLGRLTGGDTDEESVYAGTLRLLAAQLYDTGELSLGQGARLAGLSLSDFIDLCDRLEIAVLREPEEGVAAELAAFDAWFSGKTEDAQANESVPERLTIEPMTPKIAYVAFHGPDEGVEAARYLLSGA